MKKIFLSLLLVLVFCFGAYAAASDDVYLRRDVFDVEKSNVNLRFDQVLNELQSQKKENAKFSEELRKEIAKVSEEVRELRKEMNEVTKAISVLSVQITSLDKRIDTTYNFFYLITVLLGVLIAMPFIQKGLETHKEKQEKNISSFTLDDIRNDVRNLVEEILRANNLTVQGK